MERIVFFDLETGGLNPKRAPITQIGAMALDLQTLEPIELFECKVQFGVLEGTTDRALNIQKYDPDVWAREAVRSDVAAKAFSAFLRDHATVERTSKAGKPYKLALTAAYNANFDAEFLQAWYKRHKMFCSTNYGALCVLQRVRWWFSEHPTVTPPKDMKLGTVCDYFGIQLGDGAHDALNDTRATIELYKLLRKDVRLRIAA